MTVLLSHVHEMRDADDSVRWQRLMDQSVVLRGKAQHLENRRLGDLPGSRIEQDKVGILRGKFK